MRPISEFQINDIVWYIKDDRIECGVLRHIDRDMYILDIKLGAKRYAIYRDFPIYLWDEIKTLNHIILCNTEHLNELYILKNLVTDLHVDRLDGFLCREKNYILLFRDSYDDMSSATYGTSRYGPMLQENNIKFIGGNQDRLIIEESLYMQLFKLIVQFGADNIDISYLYYFLDCSINKKMFTNKNCRRLNI